MIRAAAGLWLAAALLVVALGACATGNAPEAREAEERAGTQQAVLAAIQATNVVEEFFPTPGKPSPEATTVPTLASLVLTTGVSGGEPQGSVESVPMGSTVYAAAEISHLRKGQRVTAAWQAMDGPEVARTEVEVERNGSAWVPLPWTVGGGPYGAYAVLVYVEEVLIGSLAFTVN